jgi:hypothetical protein
MKKEGGIGIVVESAAIYPSPTIRPLSSGGKLSLVGRVLLAFFGLHENDEIL